METNDIKPEFLETRIRAPKNIAIKTPKIDGDYCVILQPYENNEEIWLHRHRYPHVIRITNKEDNQELIANAKWFIDLTK